MNELNDDDACAKTQRVEDRQGERETEETVKTHKKPDRRFENREPIETSNKAQHKKITYAIRIFQMCSCALNSSFIGPF